MNHPFFEISKKVEESALNQLLMLPRILLLHARFFVCVVGGKSHDARHSNFPPTTLFFNFLFCLGLGKRGRVTYITFVIPLLLPLFPFPTFFQFSSSSFASYSCLRSSSPHDLRDGEQEQSVAPKKYKKTTKAYQNDIEGALIHSETTTRRRERNQNTF